MENYNKSTIPFPTHRMRCAAIQKLVAEIEKQQKEQAEGKTKKDE